MGIDVYLSWNEMTNEEKEARYTGFRIDRGNVGYLREAYHGAPYGTHELFPEAFLDDAPEGGVEIPNAVLVERLPKVMELVMERNRKLYPIRDEDGQTDKEMTEANGKIAAKAFEDFVKLHGEKERAGLRPTIEASY